MRTALQILAYLWYDLSRPSISTNHPTLLICIDNSRDAILASKEELSTALASLLRSESDPVIGLRLSAHTTLDLFTSPIGDREPLLAVADVDAVPEESVDNYQCESLLTGSTYLVLLGLLGISLKMEHHIVKSSSQCFCLF